jgi:hypothetical protein
LIAIRWKVSKEEVQMVSKYMKKCSTSLVTKEMQIKTTIRFHLIPVRMAKIKGNNNNKCWRGCRGTLTPIHCGGNANYYNQYGKQNSSKS